MFNRCIHMFSSLVSGIKLTMNLQHYYGIKIYNKPLELQKKIRKKRRNKPEGNLYTIDKQN